MHPMDLLDLSYRGKQPTLPVSDRSEAIAGIREGLSDLEAGEMHPFATWMRMCGPNTTLPATHDASGLSTTVLPKTPAPAFRFFFVPNLHYGTD